MREKLLPVPTMLESTASLASLYATTPYRLEFVPAQGVDWFVSSSADPPPLNALVWVASGRHGAPLPPLVALKVPPLTEPGTLPATGYGVCVPMTTLLPVTLSPAAGLIHKPPAKS